MQSRAYTHISDTKKIDTNEIDSQNMGEPTDQCQTNQLNTICRGCCSLFLIHKVSCRARCYGSDKKSHVCLDGGLMGPFFAKKVNATLVLLMDKYWKGRFTILNVYFKDYDSLISVLSILVIDLAGLIRYVPGMKWREKTKN
jgi:hypothetical protein